jgi:hypothetical protein
MTVGEALGEQCPVDRVRRIDRQQPPSDLAFHSLTENPMPASEVFSPLLQNPIFLVGLVGFAAIVVLIIFGIAAGQPRNPSEPNGRGASPDDQPNGAIASSQQHQSKPQEVNTKAIMPVCVIAGGGVFFLLNIVTKGAVPGGAIGGIIGGGLGMFVARIIASSMKTK